ncbi:MAG: hypothetical protein V5A16_00065 [Haloplanus sp.]
MGIAVGGPQATDATIGVPLQSDPGGFLLLLAFLALVYLVAQSSDDESEATTIQCRNKDCSHTWTVEDDDGFEAECPLCGMRNER